MFYKLWIKCLFYSEIVKYSKTLLCGVIHFGGVGLLFGRFFGWVCWVFLFGVFCVNRQSRMMGRSTLLSYKGCNSHMITN